MPRGGFTSAEADAHVVEICDTYLNMLHSSSASFYSLDAF